MSGTAEEKGFPLEATLLPQHREGWKDVVDLRVYHLALHLQPEGRNNAIEIKYVISKINSLVDWLAGNVLQMATYKRIYRNNDYNNMLFIWDINTA